MIFSSERFHKEQSKTVAINIHVQNFRNFLFVQLTISVYVLDLNVCFICAHAFFGPYFGPVKSWNQSGCFSPCRLGTSQSFSIPADTSSASKRRTV